MFNQLANLEEITICLDRITSMLNMMHEVYFNTAEPDERHLKQGYTDCTNVIDTIYDMVRVQRDNLQNTIDKLYKVLRGLERLSEQNMTVLETLR